MVKGTKWAVFGGKMINSTWYWKGNNSFRHIIRTVASIHGLRGEPSTLNCLTCCWLGHKSSVYQIPNTLFTNQSNVRNCHKMTNCEQFRTKCKNSSNINISYHRMSFWQKCDKNVTTGGNPECSIFFRRKMSWNFVTSCYIIEIRRSLLYHK